MTTPNEIPAAQGPQTGADGQAQTQTPAPQAAGPEQFAGFQQRINELTARAHEAERGLAAMQTQQQQLLLQIASGQATHQAQPQAPAVDIDPEERAKMEAYMAPQLAAMKAQQSQFLAQTLGTQMESVVAGVHPVVAQRARAIFADAVSKGAHLNGFSPQQALVYARGENVELLVQAAAQGQRVAQGANFNAQPQALAPQSMVAPTAKPTNAAEPDMDEDPVAAAAYYAQRIGDKTL